ncbi:hypothetical protein J2T02_002568 [Chitinophaga terrae (ex Kim and Jung 2007)]|uniref:relaxase/mobilization nuclease domain-containing protein n=1 Tax=Chitinophaga terrae (ex Kim and Jung 2007) TaxID=408074 RepID=UPI00277D2E95|nr:relaxase/mobilization nuclease domain-containing protein [Chitinophaga terrae (ex Kim and Jung 2007)]MDQ0107449.1 hypothetical protein [Chitinophaga terrae (ex Kim and Jung 2007)]
MVARIKFGAGIWGALTYNEKKVDAGKASLLAAHGYWDKTQHLAFADKYSRLQNLAERNNRVDLKCMHVSLNFDSADVLDPAKVQRIADEYMKALGFGNQPYLVYQHYDAAHPHVHIVTTTIQPNGRQKYLHNIGKRLSEPARKALEIKYGLIPAESKRQQQKQYVLPASISKALYGKAETKKALTDVVNAVIQYYKFSNIAEFDAILRQYNVTIDPGLPGSRTFQHRGLFYSLIDEKGKKVGVPIKASAIYEKPTLQVLDQKFAKSTGQLQSAAQRVSAIIERVTNLKRVTSFSEYKSELKKKGIAVAAQSPAPGMSPTLVYVDNVKRMAFEQAALSAGCRAESVFQTITAHLSAEKWAAFDTQLQAYGSVSMLEKFLETVLQPEQPNYTPDPYKKKKMRKRKGLHL